MSVHPTPLLRLSAQEDETAGSADTFEDFFAATNPRLFTALWLVTGDRYEAEEIAQDAFLRVFERWDRVGRLDDPESPDLERAERIGEFWSYPHSRTIGELLA